MLITAGPTHEPIDAVRYIANRSSGRMGVALAEAARDAGWTVTLLLGPVSLSPPAGVQMHPFQTTADLAALLDQHFPACDVLIMAAAVADYRLRASRRNKLPRESEPLTLTLEPTPDLVAACAARKRPGQRIVGFALEQPAALERHAWEKLRHKQLDAVVANPLATMGSADISATVFTAAGESVRPPLSTGAAGRPGKAEFARWLIAWIEETWFKPGG
jgi:phosphopantothenoylcysteine decarboxylase/phosphopantothenate--cysteine ligase